MRHRSSLWRLVLASLWRLAVAPVALLVLGVFASAVSAQTATVRLADDSELNNQTPSITGKMPVLFVHGHGGPSNYQVNWQQPLTARNLPSFKDVLLANPDLAIEPYYISFADNDTRSITTDAIEIGDAVERILRRHDPNNPVENTSVKVVIIAYSQGTISTRQYLKSLQTQVDGMPAPPPNFRPVSEFIAIAPPNHGLATRLFSTTNSVSVKQLYNGQRPRRVLPPDPCGDSFGEPAATDYIEILNKANANDPHVIEDTQNLNAGQIYSGEAPGSRSLTDPQSAGTLYVTLFDANDRDLVGGDIASGDCVGRAVASNRAPNAVNIPVTGISEDGWETVLDANSGFDIGNIASALFSSTEKKSASVHQNTVHTFEVMCQALYTAVHHTSPEGVVCSPVNVTVPGLPNQVPVPIIPPPRAAAMLTLDFSGSMSLSTGPNATRASVLKEAVELFVSLWQAVSVPTDRLGATYFRTSVTRFPTSGDPLPLLSSDGQSIVDDLNNNQSPGNLTAMGGGLQRAIEALNGVAADTPIRRVILFTDGMQNVNPMVQNVGGQLTINDEPGRPGSGVTVPPTPFVLNPSLGITAQQPRAISIDTIGIGAGETFVTRLAEIATATNGHTKATVDIDLLRQFFVEELINALKGFSPQLVDYRRGTVAKNGSTEAFAIEDDVHKLVLKTSWKRGDSVDFTVVKDGVDVTVAGRFIKGDFYKIFVIDLPAKGIVTRGKWQVRIKGKSGTAYEAAAIVDGSAITYDSKVRLKQPRAGDPLDLVIRMTARGKPVRSTTRAIVTLLSPTATAGDIIANTPPKESPALEPGMSVGERQLLALTQDPKSLALLRGKPTKLTLKPTSKGEFRARLSTGVPGIYTAFITVEGSDPKLGQFRRTMAITTVVRSAGADQKMTSIVISRPIGGPARIVVTPRDASGHFIGPGWGSNVSLELTNGVMVGAARDLGNGSYELSFDVQSGKDPSATVKIAGKAFYTGTLSQLPRTRR